VRDAQAVVVCPTPFGPGNAVNLDLALRAREQSIPVFLAAGVTERDYTPDRRATKDAARLIEQGAQEWDSVADLFALLQSRGTTA